MARRRDELDSLDSLCKKAWEEVRARVSGAAVFIEDCCAECLHWDGGLVDLLDSGAAAVSVLSSFESAGAEHRKGVFVCRGTPENLDTIKEIIRNSAFVQCILILATGAGIIESEMGVTVAQLKSQCTAWMASENHVVEIVHCPIFAVSITDNVFATPTFSSLYPKFGDRLVPDPQTGADLDLHSLSSKDKYEVRRLAYSFHRLLEAMGAREDIFYVGPFSSVLSGVLEHLPEAAQRRKNYAQSVSVIFIDRTVDLTSVTTHQTNSLLDKMVNLLPRFPGHSVDLAVDISALASSKMVSIVDDLHLCPGCIAHQNDNECKQVLEHLISKSQSEAMFSLYNKLTKIADATPNRMPPRITPQNLEKLVNSFAGKQEKILENCGILQQSLGIIQTLKSPEIQQLDLLVCLEKQVLQSITTSKDSTSVLSQISLIIKTWKTRGLSIDRILALLVNIYSLAAGYITFSESQEKDLKDSLSVALFEDYSERRQRGEGPLVGPEEASKMAEELIGKLRDIARIRDSFQRYKTVIKMVDKVSPSEYNGILQQLVCDMVDVRKPEMPDLKCRSSGLKDLLKSGLSMLINTTTKSGQSITKHPFDNQTVIIFVIGGMTFDECAQMHRNVMISGTDTNVMIGSTNFVNSVEAMKQALMLER